MRRKPSLAARASDLAKALTRRAEELRALAAQLDDQACALECAAMLDDERTVERIEAWSARHRAEV